MGTALRFVLLAAFLVGEVALAAAPFPLAFDEEAVFMFAFPFAAAALPFVAAAFPPTVNF